MIYMMTDISTHIDFGFGVTASSYLESAEKLEGIEGSSFRGNEMPIMFLYRHSVELYLKSMIIIVHKKLKLSYKDESIKHDSENPYVFDFVKSEWRKITACHDIFTLYKYLINVVGEYQSLLEKIAPKGNWNISNIDNEKYIEIIKEYDFDSTYFRYPVTKQIHLDHQKSSIIKSDE